MSVEIKRKAPQPTPIAAVTAGVDGRAVEFREDRGSLAVRLHVTYGAERYVLLSRPEVLALAAALNLWAQQ